MFMIDIYVHIELDVHIWIDIYRDVYSCETTKRHYIFTRDRQNVVYIGIYTPYIVNIIY